MKNKKIEWVDVLKGIGIICVVLAHMDFPFKSLYTLIYLFHMPLFFFLGGYLFKPEKNIKEYFKKKTIHLLLPYFSFLIILYLPGIFFRTESRENSISYLLFAAINGGRFLTGDVGIFWFVSCFFLTQQLFNFILTRIRSRKKLFFLNGLFLFIAYLNHFYNPYIFWDANVVFYAFPVFYAGYCYRTYGAEVILNRYNLLFLIVSVAIYVFTLYCNPEWLAVNMRDARYGYPLVCFLLSLVIVQALIILSKTIALKSSFLKSGLSYTGSGSMIIMYIHIFFYHQISSLFDMEWYVCFFIVLFICLFVYFLVKRYTFTRAIFLGDRNAYRMFLKRNQHF